MAEGSSRGGERPDDVAGLLDTVEGRRLRSADADGWRRWGPYLSERQWGTVREDYSAGGEAWDYLTHDQSRSRAYRWGEDGIAGFSDDHQLWCQSLALWNGRDPIIKERMFGLSNGEGNHGEDVKELWWYVDGTPTHSYMRMLYKYPQALFPYDALVAENGRRRGHDLSEYEIVDTGVFDGGRYFDITVEYAKAAPDDVLMRVTVLNRAAEPAALHVLSQLWARNTWSWSGDGERPQLRLDATGRVRATRRGAPERIFSALQEAEFVFCENDTNPRRLFGMDVHGHFKDGINNWLVASDEAAVNPAHEGTKCAAVTRLSLEPGARATLRFRFAPAEAATMDVDGFERAFADRLAEADQFYDVLQRDVPAPDARLVQRQALAGMLWSKQYFHLDVRRWLAGDAAQPPPPAGRRHGRNADWRHLNNADIISMPDKWEYPWYAAWDLAFHCVTLALVDPDFAKGQLILLTREWYMHPSGQLPAYEWAFGDVNPPVHAWATWRVYQADRVLTGTGDRLFLERVFHKLMLNFTWWVNRKDVGGRNVFQGGFLGLDNIGLFDRSQPLPTGGYLAQADGTAWMAMYALNLMRIALELAVEDPVYEDIATKFFEHFLSIAEAMTDLNADDDGPTGLWDEQDQFFYDMLNLPDGSRQPMRVRSLVGLIPLCAVEVIGNDLLDRFPGFASRLRWVMQHRPELAALVSRWEEPGRNGRILLSLLRRHRMRALLVRMLDETEFLSDHGIRAVSKIHAAEPFRFDAGGREYMVDYEPGESKTGLFGGNSNWRGPVWMPINYLLLEALHEFEKYYGTDFRVDCPTGSGTSMSLGEVAAELAGRLNRLFLRQPDGRRAVFGTNRLYQEDAAFRDLVPFHEYFHGDTGAGLGASHQTGWTGLAALLLRSEPEQAGPASASATVGTAGAGPAVAR